jgi:hypothetical protein
MNRPAAIAASQMTIDATASSFAEPPIDASSSPRP